MDELWQAGESHPGGDVVPPTIQGADPVVFDDVPVSGAGVSHGQGIGIWRRSRRSCEDKLHPSQSCLLFPWLPAAANQPWLVPFQGKCPRICSYTLPSLRGAGRG